MKNALDDKGWEYKVDEGGGAFYGPKIDLKIEDALGRKWQCSTVQVNHIFLWDKRYSNVKMALKVTKTCLVHVNMSPFFKINLIHD